MNFVQPIRDTEKLREIEAALRRSSDRDYMLFVTGTNTGLRISDLLRLRVGDIKSDHIVLREKKTGKSNRIPLSSRLKKALKTYTRNMNSDRVLFVSRIGSNKAITRSTAYAILRKAADQVGISEIGTHTMRKTFGYHFYAIDKNVALLQKILNHSKPSTTLRYIGVTQDDIDSAMKGFSI